MVNHISTDSSLFSSLSIKWWDNAQSHLTVLVVLAEKRNHGPVGFVGAANVVG